MFKFTVVILAVIVCVAAKPSLIGAPFAYHTAAAIVAAPAPVVTATSSQVVARNHNGIATAPIIAPVATPVIARTVAPAALLHSAPLVYSAPLAYSAAAHYAAAPILW